MSIKDILVHVDSTDAGRVRAALGISLARRFDARLVGVHVILMPDVPRHFRPAAARTITTLFNELSSEAANLAEAHWKEQVSALGTNSVWRAVVGDLAEGIAFQAAFCDLAIVGQSDTEYSTRIWPFLLPGAVVLCCGRPVMVVPATGSFATFPDRILVAWDASAEASRAIHDALPLLKFAKMVVLLTVDSPGQDADFEGANAKGIAEHLLRHGVSVQIEEVCSAAKHPWELILSTANRLGAELIVMGAYRRSRASELIFGGTTRGVLSRMTVPVFISH